MALMAAMRQHRVASLEMGAVKLALLPGERPQPLAPAPEATTPAQAAQMTERAREMAILQRKNDAARRAERIASRAGTLNPEAQIAADLMRDVGKMVREHPGPSSSTLPVEG